MIQVGELNAHKGWVTAIAVTPDPNTLVTGSRDKTLIIWQLDWTSGGRLVGRPLKRLFGHEHFIEDVAISSDGRFALSGSWDKTLRLWDLEESKCTSRFVHHTSDVLSVSFSADNRQICSGSRDKSVILWNTLGEHNFTLQDEKNKDWISCVAFSPKSENEKTEENSDGEETKDCKVEMAPKDGKESQLSKDYNTNFLVYSSWNGTIKKFDLSKLAVTYNFQGHSGPVTTITISPDASLCASGGKDGQVVLWDLITGANLRQLSIDGSVVSLKFNPGHYWLCGLSENSVYIWNLVTKKGEDQVVVTLDFEQEEAKRRCTSAEWAKDGETLLCGFKDGVVRAYRITEKGAEETEDDFEEEECLHSDFDNEFDE